MNHGGWTRDRGRTAAGAALIGLLTLAGCGIGRDAAGPPAGVAAQSVGRWRLALVNTPDPPRVGENTMTVYVRDETGKPMVGDVEVAVAMEAMGAMPRMESRGKVRGLRAGVYRVTYALAMSGEWDLFLRLRPRDGSPVEASYRVSTSMRGVAYSGGTPGAQEAASTTRIGAPSTADDAGDSTVAGTVVIDDARRQSLGIRTAAVAMRDLSSTLRAPGRVAWDEAHQAEISLRVGGWVRELRASVTGQSVRSGEVLFSFYSPEIWAAQQEYLEALRATREDSARANAGDASRELAAAARERLRLWGVADAEIAAIARAGKPRESVSVRAPMAGVITEKNVVLGSAVNAGQVLYRIARLNPVWVIAGVPQSDLPLVRMGSTALVADPDRDGRSRQGRISFIGAGVDSMTRTGEVRIELANPGGALRPGAYVDVEFSTPLARSLAVPETAVLPTGERHVVFVDLGEGRLAPREVRLGRRAGGYYEVLNGLRAGDQVVTSGNFVVAAESRLRSGAASW
jgi:membrane fusion protein, copper/silver efflux system